MDLPIQLEPRDFDWHRVYGHEEFLDEVLDRHAWKVMELLFALEYEEAVDSGEGGLESLWDLIDEEQNTAIEDPEQSHPALVFADLVPETYFMTARLVQQAGGMRNGETSELIPLSDEMWQLSAQLANAQLPIVGLASMTWEEHVDVVGDLMEAEERHGMNRDCVRSSFLPATSPGAQRWRLVQQSSPRLAEALMRLEDFKAAYEAFLSVSTFDPHVEELAWGLFRATMLAHAAVLQYCLPDSSGLCD